MLKYTKENYKLSEKVVVICEECLEEHITFYRNWLNSKTRAKYGKDFCKKCRYKDGRCPTKNKSWYYDSITNESFIVTEEEANTRGLIKGNINVKGENNPMSKESIMSKYGCCEEEAKKHNPFYGKKHSPEKQKQISEAISKHHQSLTEEERKELFGTKYVTDKDGNKVLRKGKTNVELYGEEKANQMLSNQIKGFEEFVTSEKYVNWCTAISNRVTEYHDKLHPFSGNKNPSSKESVALRNECSVEEAYKYMPMYGKKCSDITKKKLALAKYGNVPSNNSGIGFSGIYKSFNFRSSYELSYLIEILQYTEINIKSAENIINIPYRFEEKDRTYRPDFIIDDLLIEIKPEKLLTKKENVVKFMAAEDFCKNNNLTFIILTEKDLNLLDRRDIISLYLKGEITLYENTKRRLNLV